MATYNTSQAGDWNSPTTWGGSGFPVNGDTANITHVVTYNINDDTATIAAININTNGTLQWLTGLGTRTLRFTNMTITGGKLIGRDGTFLRCLGYIQVANTAASEINMKGSIPNSQTTLASNLSVGDSFLVSTSSTGFGIGDYISVYNYDTLSYTSQTNEDFIINYISGNNIYLRRFVGPKFTLIQDTPIGSNVFYTNSDVRAWPIGSKFIIDNEVFTVDSIDVVNKIIYTTSNSMNNWVTGKVGYETGVEYAHTSGEVVYKLCTTIVGATVGNNYIDVNSSGGWSINDEIAIGGSTYANSENKTITNISIGGGANGSDRLTLNSNLDASHDVDGIVVKINRDCIFQGTATNVISATSGYIYIIAGATNRTFRFENFEMRYYGSNASELYAGLTLRTYYNRSAILLNMVGRHAYKGNNVGSMWNYSYSYNVFINNVVYDTQSGIGTYSSGGQNSHYSGNIAMKVNSISFWNYSSSIYAAWDYNIVESCNGYGMYNVYPGYILFGTLYNGKIATRNWYMRINYCVTANYDYMCFHSRLEMKKWNIKNTSRINYREGISTGASILQKINLETGNPWNIQMSTDYNRSDTYMLLNQITLYDDFNFIRGNKLLSYTFGYGEMDENIKKNSKYSWKFTPNNNAYQRTIGFFAVIVGQKGKTIKVGGFLRKTTTTNATVRIDMYNDKNVLLTSSTLTSTNTWEWKTASYTITEDSIIIAKIGGYGSTSNFWVSHPTLYADGCLAHTDILSNFWIIGDPTATGIRLSNGIKMI